MAKQDKLFKKTKSLDVACGIQVPAVILEEDDKIYMSKKSLSGPEERFLIEKDGGFYKCVCQDTKPRCSFKKIVLDITFACNLSCKVCYRDEHGEDMALDTIKKISKKFKGIVFVLSGGEPTIRKDLPEIIRLLSIKNSVIIATNGIKLAELEYVRLLKKSGLKGVLFSLNGFDDKVLEEINGRKLLNIKTLALANLKKLRINTILSFLLVRDINEDQILKMISYYRENRDFIKELRIRSMIHVGKYINREKYFLSEIADLVSKQLHIQREDITNEAIFKKSINQCFHKQLFMLDSCQTVFHLKVLKGGMVPVGSLLRSVKNPLCAHKTLRGYFILFADLYRVFGIRWLFLGLGKSFFYSWFPIISEDCLLKIGLRSWPDISNVDLNETCQTGCLKGEEIIPFCHANIV